VFVFTIISVAMPGQLIKKAKRPRILTTLEIKLKLFRSVEAEPIAARKC
jgi:hypothetical protein